MDNLIIKRAQNGYIMEWTEDWGEDTIKDERIVIEGDDEKDSMTRLLEAVSDYFGLHYDKWGEDNLRISWDRRGHKVE